MNEQEKELQLRIALALEAIVDRLDELVSELAVMSDRLDSVVAQGES